MKKVSQSLDEKLLDYIDGNLAPGDREEVETKLKNDSVASSRYETLLTIHNLLHVQIGQPSKKFTERVMNNLNVLPVSNSMPIRSTLILLSGVVIAISIAVLFVSYGMFDGVTTSINLNEVPISDGYWIKTLPSFSFEGRIFMNIMIFLNLAITLIILDKAVLKPFFQRRLSKEF